LHENRGIKETNGTTFAAHGTFFVLFNEVVKMKKTAEFLALIIIFPILSLPCTVSADKSFKIHTPRGGLTSLLISTCALKKVRIHKFEFSESGDTFSVEAVPNGSSDSIESLLIEFHEDSISVQSDFVDIGPGRTEQKVYCPESFDQIVIDCSGY
jgi:hypothetical protein